MAKHNCAICGAEVNIFQQQQLADKNYVCRKVCVKRAMKDFDLIGGVLYNLQEHIKQVEEGTKIYEKLFIPNKKKLKWFGAKTIAVSEELGLIAKLEDRYKIFIFGKTTRACVYRIADLYGYEYEHEFETSMSNAASGSKTSTQKKVHFTHFYFWDTPGMSDFRIKIAMPNTHTTIEKYFNKLFGIQKTATNFKMLKNQFAAVKSMGSAIKSVVSGGDDMEAKAGEAAQAMERAQYGDRTEWIAKADAALRGV